MELKRNCFLYSKIWKLHFFISVFIRPFTCSELYCEVWSYSSPDFQVYPRVQTLTDGLRVFKNDFQVWHFVRKAHRTPWKLLYSQYGFNIGKRYFKITHSKGYKGKSGKTANEKLPLSSGCVTLWALGVWQQ